MYDGKENFASKLRWLRWKIYQKVENKISTAVDVEKYEELVNKFVSKFETTRLSDWEVSIWKNKVLKTKNDVHAVILRNNSEASVDLSEVSSQESLCDDDNEPEVASCQFFDKANAYEHLCSNLPNVPELEAPDEEIGKRLWRLKERDKNDEFETDIDMFGKHKHEETESKTNHPKSDKKDADVIDDKNEGMGEIKNPESFNDSVQTFESDPNNINAFDTNKEEFNDWYESQLKMKLRKSNVRVLSEEPPGHIYSSRLDDNMEYKQLFATSSDSHVQGGDNKAPDLLCFLQAYFVLLISTCKTLNEAIEKFSHSSFPVIPYQPIQPTPLSARTSRFTPRSMYCECESRGYCVNTTTAIVRGVVTFSDMTTTATAGASVFYKWMSLQLQHLKENVILTILSVGVGEQFESIEELKRTRVKSESIKLKKTYSDDLISKFKI